MKDTCCPGAQPSSVQILPPQPAIKATTNALAGRMKAQVQCRPQSTADLVQMPQSFLSLLSGPHCWYVMRQISRALTLTQVLFSFLSAVFPLSVNSAIFPMLLPLLISPAVLTCYTELEIMSCISGALRNLLTTHVSEPEKTFLSYWAQLELRQLKFQNIILKR